MRLAIAARGQKSSIVVFLRDRRDPARHAQSAARLGTHFDHVIDCGVLAGHRLPRTPRTANLRCPTHSPGASSSVDGRNGQLSRPNENRCRVSDRDTGPLTEHA